MDWSSQVPIPTGSTSGQPGGGCDDPRALADTGPEGYNRVQLTRDLAAFVNDCGLLLPKYHRNVVAGLLLVALGAQRIPYAGPIVLVGWDNSATSRDEAEVVDLTPIQVGMIRALHAMVGAWLDGTDDHHVTLDAHRDDEIAEALELAEQVANGDVPKWTYR